MLPRRKHSPGAVWAKVTLSHLCAIWILSALGADVAPTEVAALTYGSLLMAAYRLLYSAGWPLTP